MKQEDKDLLLKDLCARLPYGVRGKVKADGIDPYKYDIDGFPLEITFDVDVELQRIDVSNDEIFVSTFDNNEDLGNYIEECQIDANPWTIEEFTPYLRPMSSMTDEEREQYRKFSYYGAAGMRDNDFIEMVAAPSFEKMDYLNSHHFDYRGLIEKGLALKAPDYMYKDK